MERLTESGEWHIDGDQGPSDAWDWVFPVSTTTSELPSVIPQYTYTDSTGTEWISRYNAAQVPIASIESAILAECPNWYAIVLEHIDSVRISSKLNKSLADRYVWLKSFFCDYFIGVERGHFGEAFDIANAEDSTVEVISLKNPVCIERWKEFIEE